MKHIYTILLFSLLFSIKGFCQAEPSVIVYDFPAKFPVSERYSVTVDGLSIAPLHTKRGAILNFGMSGSVRIRVDLDTPAKEVTIRPLHTDLKAEIDDKGFYFDLPRPMNLSVEVNGDIADPLLVFANPKLPAPPSKDDPKVKYFEAGKIHQVGEIFLKSGETLYAETGAIVNGEIRAVGANNVAIRGGGIINAGYRNRKINMLVLRECQNAVIEDIILLDSLGWTVHLSGSQDINISNIRVIGWRANSDGLDIEYSRRVRADRCFWRTNDDCIAVKAIYPPGEKDIPFTEMINPETIGKRTAKPIPGDVIGDVLITNSVLWNDRNGQGFEIGFEVRVDHIRNVTFRDCDIIHVKSGGAFSIHNGERANIEGILLENIRVENTDRLFDFHIGLSIYSEDCPEPYRRTNPKRKRPSPRNVNAHAWSQWLLPQGEEVARYEAKRGTISNIVIRNMTVATKPSRNSILHGYSKNKGISGVTFEGLTIAGEKIHSVEQLDLYQTHVTGLHFRAKP